MPHPLIEQFCRIPGHSACQPHFFNRLQRELRDDVQPKLDERDRLLVENESLKTELTALKGRLDKKAPKASEAA